MALMIEIEKEPAKDGADPGAAAGKALAKAIKAGDGAAVYAAFKELKYCCEDEDMGDEEDDDE